MKIIHLLFLFLLVPLHVKSQNPYKYETKVDHFILYHFDNGRWLDRRAELQNLIKNYNNQGYKLSNIAEVSYPMFEGEPRNQRAVAVILTFEKSDSYREAELQKLINELTTRIDAASKKHTDSAMAAININVINYLKSIPNDVITKEYKEQLTKQILLDAEEKIKQVAEELKKEVRSTSTSNRQ